MRNGVFLKPTDCEPNLLHDRSTSWQTDFAEFCSNGMRKGTVDFLWSNNSWFNFKTLHKQLSNIILTGEYIKPLQWKMYTKSHIPAILNTYWPGGAQSVDPLPYLAAASVLPMRTNNYVVTQLIDWSAVPDDPMFQLTFPQPGKLQEFSIRDFVSNKTV